MRVPCPVLLPVLCGLDPFERRAWIQRFDTTSERASRAKRWARGAKNIGEAVFATTCREHSAQRHCMPQLNPQINLAAEPFS
jgi:hypothetical protein